MTRSLELNASHHLAIAYDKTAEELNDLKDRYEAMVTSHLECIEIFEDHLRLEKAGYLQIDTAAVFENALKKLKEVL